MALEEGSSRLHRSVTRLARKRIQTIDKASRVVGLGLACQKRALDQDENLSLLSVNLSTHRSARPASMPYSSANFRKSGHLMQALTAALMPKTCDAICIVRCSLAGTSALKRGMSAEGTGFRMYSPRCLGVRIDHGTGIPLI